METPTQKFEFLLVSDISKSLCNQRFIPNEAQIFSMTHTLNSTGSLPPIFVRKEGNNYACYDGMHRLEAYRRCSKTHISVIIDNDTSESNAMINSWNYNNGRQCSDGEKANLCLNLYRRGMTTSQIMQHLSFQSEEMVKTYVKFALYLHPNMLMLIQKGGSNRNSIPIEAAKELMRANKEQQPFIYDAILNKKGSKLDNIKALIFIRANTLSFPTQNSIPTSTPSSLPTSTSNSFQFSASTPFSITYPSPVTTSTPKQYSIPYLPPVPSQLAPSQSPFQTSSTIPFISLEQDINDLRAQIERITFRHNCDRQSIIYKLF